MPVHPLIIKIFVVIFSCLGGCNILYAQESTLERTISIETGNASPEAFLQKVEETLNIRFSYNADILPDKQITINASDESLLRILKAAFGKSYVFRSNGRYVIILKREKREARQQSTDIYAEIRGRVVEWGSGSPLAAATIYDLSTRRSVLTDSSGQFSLAFSPDSRTIGLRCSKQGFSDSIRIIDYSREEDVVFKLHPLRLSMGAVEAKKSGNISGQADRHIRILRRLVSAESFINSLNVRIFDKQPVQLSLLPSIGTNFRMSGSIINHFSINLLSGYSAGVQGFEGGGILNMNRFDVNGMQVSGLANLAGGNMSGFQAAGLYNRIGGDIRGVQLSGGINTGADSVDGVQLAGLINRRTAYVNGLQLAIIANSTEGEVRGAQISAIYNYSKKPGFQFGLVNVADTNSGTPMGLINIVDGGLYGCKVYSDGLHFQQAFFYSGTQRMYSMLGLTLFNLYPERKPGISFGLGRTWWPEGFLQLSTEFTASVIAASGSFDRHSLSLVNLSPMLSKALLSGRLRILAGPSFNLMMSDKANSYSEEFSTHIREGLIYTETPSETRFDAWPGIRAGVSYIFFF